MEFDLKMVPPTVTAQEHKVRVINGRPQFYDTARLKDARHTFETLLRAHKPEQPLEGPVSLKVEWRFHSKTHVEGAYRVTRPDTDNLQKLLKDCMTRAGFWRDDAQVCLETVIKSWSRDNPGIRIKVVSLHDD